MGRFPSVSALALGGLLGAACAPASDQEAARGDLDPSLAGAAQAAEAAPAPPAYNCGPRGRVFAVLALEYHEAPIAVWQLDSGALMTFLGAVDGGTWTLVVSAPDGIACVADSGANWRPQVEGLGAPGT